MSSAALRNQVTTRLVQSFSATSPKITPVINGARHLSISGAREANPTSTTSSFESTVASIPKRSDVSPSGHTYNTSRTMKQVNDSSTVDFAYIPPISFTHAISAEYSRIPLLPDNYMVKHQDTSPEPHLVKPEISTATYTDTVVSMSEAESSKAADGMGLNDVVATESTVKRVWNDFLDDVLGSATKKTGATA